MSEEREERKEREETPTTVGRAPIDDGWEPERPRFPSRFGDGPVEYFRAVPARGFAWLGTFLLVGGWLVAIYIAWFGDDQPFSGLATAQRLQLMVSVGMQATIASGILFGVAAYLWVRVLPATADDSA